MRTTADNRRRIESERRSIEKKDIGKMRQDKRRDEGRRCVSSSSQQQTFVSYQSGLHTPASEKPCSHFGLHSLDVCFVFAIKACHIWSDLSAFPNY